MGSLCIRNGPKPLTASEEDEGTTESMRAYQMEMLQLSLEENVIVVMDTGSGKTLVAIQRIRFELEHGKSSKLVWFLAPTVTLCMQQFQVILRDLPSVSARSITGSDNVELWSTQEIWNRVLGSHRIIVSTHAILSDALSHGFVTMSRLGLLIFDEAHHCTGEHPANKIMRDFYHPLLASGGSEAVPHILGLTASPIMKSNVSAKNLRLIESNLNARSISPRIHRADLRRFVHLPRFIRMDYTTQPTSQTSPLPEKLKRGLPLVRLHKTAVSGRGKNKSTIDIFHRKAHHVYTELGLWASEHFIDLVLANLLESPNSEMDEFRQRQGGGEGRIQCASSYLRLPASISHDIKHSRPEFSPKVQELIKFLVSQRDSQMSGILFVDQRVTATMLQKLLSTHPDTKHLSYATFVGTSNPSIYTRCPTELVNLDDQKTTLEDFRSQKCDMIIATNVLEEGIDISSCNLVICFNKPDNLKSFIQRRGRARDKESIFVLMLAEEDSSARGKNWETMEANMLKIFEEQQKKAKSELQLEDLEEHRYRRFEIESTCALLTLETAIPHLNHFCARLPACEYADNRPVYQFQHLESDLVKAEVILPTCLDPTVRRASGREYWLSERLAKKDAAFEAYVALYNAGLVNDNLLPEPKIRYEPATVQERARPSLIPSSGMNPWAQLADLWKEFPDVSLHPTVITVERPLQSPLKMVMLLPESLPVIPSCRLLWSPAQTYTASFQNFPLPACQVDGKLIDLVREISYVIYHSAHSAKMQESRVDIVTIFVPSLDTSKLVEWKKENIGTEAAAEVKQRPCLPAGIVRSPVLWNAPQFFDKWLDDDSLQVVTLPRKRNFLDSERASSVRRSRLLNNRPSAKVRSFPVEDSKFDRISPADIEFSLLIPSLLRHVETYYIAAQLATSVLPAVRFEDLKLVVEALLAPSADDVINYQRLEHIGDTVLKFLTVTHLFSSHKNWHEGYLSEAKDVIVANNRLAQAAIQTKLDRYILSAPFAARKWTPAYIEPLSGSKPLPKRRLSTKILGDVVEALIGAAYVEGGLQRAAECVQWLLPEINHQKGQEILRNGGLLVYSVEYRQDNFTALQRLLGYQFNSLNLLVEAITHPSLTSDLFTTSYQRLEFLGDAVLDMVVMQRLSSQTPTLSQNQMHLIRSALNNINFQAFLCMEMSLEEEISDVTSCNAAAGVTNVELSRRVPLCKFMRYQSAEMAKAYNAYLERHKGLAAKIRDAIEHGKNYPWSLLTRLEAPKYLSDMVESIFGAVLVDSRGSLAMCEKLADRIGLMSYLNRVLRDDIDLLHPQTRLNELANGIGKVKYHVRKVEDPVEEFRCLIVVGDRKFEEAVGGTSREEVAVRASEMAVLALTESLR